LIVEEEEEEEVGELSEVVVVVTTKLEGWRPPPPPVVPEGVGVGVGVHLDDNGMGLQPLEFTDCLTDSPYFRENLHAHEKELERTSSQIKVLVKDVKEILNAARCEFLIQLIIIIKRTLASTSGRSVEMWSFVSRVTFDS
jgi:hypothetical protein